MRHYAMKITMHYARIKYPRHLGFAIIAGHHLETWVRFLNAFNVVHNPVVLPRDPEEEAKFDTIYFQICAETLHYNGSRKTMAYLENGIQGVREIVPHLCSTVLEVVVLDRFGQKYKDAYQILPPLTLEECFISAQVAKNSGDKLVTIGQYFEAQGGYAIAARLLGAPLWGNGNREEQFSHYSNEHLELCMRTWISMAHLSSTLRQAKSDQAIYSLVEIVSEWLDQGYGSPGLEDSEVVDVTIWKADLESDKACSAARDTLLKALRSQPGHERLTAELQKLKKKQLQRWRDDVEKQFPPKSLAYRNERSGDAPADC
jgi:hypothetical protein